MVTSGTSRRSSRLPRVTGRAASASASASGGKIIGRPSATAVISVSAEGSSGRPTRSLTLTRGPAPAAGSGTISATTRSPGSAPARSSPRHRELGPRLAVGRADPQPVAALLDDAGHLARLARQDPDRPRLEAALGRPLQPRQHPVADGRRGTVQVLDRQHDAQLRLLGIGQEQVAVVVDAGDVEHGGAGRGVALGGAHLRPAPATALALIREIAQDLLEHRAIAAPAGQRLQDLVAAGPRTLAFEEAHDVGAGRRRRGWRGRATLRSASAALGAALRCTAGFFAVASWPSAWRRPVPCRARNGVGRPPPSASLASRSASSWTACFQREGVGLRRLRQAGVQLAVLDVGAEPTRQQLDRLIVLGVPPQLAQRCGRCGRTPALGRLVEQRHRPVHADGQHVVAGLEADVLLLELHVGPVAVDAGHDRLPGLRIAPDLARQRRAASAPAAGPARRAACRAAASCAWPRHRCRAACRGRTGRS